MFDVSPYSTAYLKAFSKTYQLIRHEWDISKHGALTVGMSCYGKDDRPYDYDMVLFKHYDLTFKAGIKGLFIKRMYINYDHPLRTHFKYYNLGLEGRTEVFLNTFKKYRIEKFDIDTLIMLANKDWLKTTDNRCSLNLKLIRIMYNRYINTLKYYKVIKYDELQKIYIDYNFQCFK